MGSALVWGAAARGSSLVQVAPMRAQRMRAAGPGRFSARLRMRVPFSGWGSGRGHGWHAAVERAGRGSDRWGLRNFARSLLQTVIHKLLPVLQLSMDYSRPPAEHYALGQQLQRLRERAC